MSWPRRTSGVSRLISSIVANSFTRVSSFMANDPQLSENAQPGQRAVRSPVLLLSSPAAVSQYELHGSLHHRSSILCRILRGQTAKESQPLICRTARSASPAWWDQHLGIGWAADAVARDRRSECPGSSCWPARRLQSDPLDYHFAFGSPEIHSRSIFADASSITFEPTCGI